MEVKREIDKTILWLETATPIEQKKDIRYKLRKSD